MNLSNLSLHSLSEALAWTLLHSVWQAVIITGLVALAFHIIDRNNAKLRYAIASMAMLLIFVLAALTFLIALPERVMIESGINKLATYELGNQTKVSNFSLVWLKSLFPTHVLFPILLRAWLVGVILLSFKMIISYLQVIRIKNVKVFNLNSKHLILAKNLLKRLNIKKEVVFRESALIDSPSLVGYFKPVILLPVSLISGIPDNQLEIIIAHELAHIRRHDYLVQFIQGIIEILFFYHPMVWWLSSVVNTEREHICDDLAVKVCGESLTLIKALNNMESIRKKKPELVLNFSGKKANLLHRVRRILNPETIKHPKLERGLLSVLFVLALSSMVLFSNLANSKNQKDVSPSTNLATTDLYDSQSSQIGPVMFAPQKKKRLAKKTKNTKIVFPDSSQVDLSKESTLSYPDLKEESNIMVEAVAPVAPVLAVSPEFPVIPEAPLSPVSISDTLTEREIEKALEVEKEALEEALKELETVEVEINEESIKELKESLKELESIDINIEKELLEAEANFEIELKELDELQEIDSFEEIDNNKDLSEQEKADLKAKIKSSLKKMNSEEFRSEMKETLERSKESLKLQIEKIKSGEFKKMMENQKEKIKEMIIKFESSDFQNNLKENLKKSHEHIKERLKEIESPEYQKELKEKIEKCKKKNKKAKIKFGSKNPPLCIMNGKEISMEEMESLNKEEIKSVSVLKGANADAYGKKGKNGVILIQTQKSLDKESIKENILKFKGNSKKAPLVYVDGVKLDVDEKADDIYPDEIETIVVLKDKSAIDKYGKKAVNGVIEITTKK